MFSSKIVTINDPNLIGALLLLRICQSGGKTAYIPQHSGHIYFLPELTSFYPFKIGKTPRAISQYEFLFRLSAPFLHLLYQTRVFSFSLTEKPSAKQLALTDTFLGRDREQASFPTQVKNMKQLGFLSDFGFTTGALVIEYRFDRLMAIHELLLKASQLGLIKHEGSSMLTNNDSLVCCVFNSNSMVFHNQRIHCTNGLNLHFGTFRLSLFSVLNNSYLTINHKENMDTANCFTTVFTLLITAGIQPNTAQTEELKTLCVNRNTPPQTNSASFPDFSLEELPVEFNRMEKKIRKTLGIKPIPFNELPDKHFFKEQQQRCEEKFDLAKQTGIEYEHFAWLYHRYAPVIDDMIERAYELFNQERNPKIIWEKVVNERTQ